MLIAFVGAHRTGKTTTCNALQKQLGKQQWPIFEDYYRKICRQLGYPNSGIPILEEPHRETTITAMTASALGSLALWSQNNSLNDLHGLIDLGPPSMLAIHRYWMKICDKPVSPFLLKLYHQVTDNIDYYVYLPSGIFPLGSNSMKKSDPIFQKDIDQWVLGNLNELNIPSHKVIRPESCSADERVSEILEIILPEIQKSPAV